MSVTPPISIVIPTLDEAVHLRRLLPLLLAEPGPHEIIVVDGGSQDSTVAVAGEYGVRVIHSTAGRGMQLRTGAAAARGQVIWFLHADSLPGKGALRAIQDRLTADPALVGGNFRLVFDGDDGFSRWLTGFYAKIRRFGLYYGDSGIYVRRWVLERIGGVLPYPIMEDHELVRQMHKLGPTACIGEPFLCTSARRFHGRHPLRIFAGWLWMHLLYWLGVSPWRLGRCYYRRAYSRP